MKTYQQTSFNIRQRLIVAIGLGCITSCLEPLHCDAAPPAMSESASKKSDKEQSNSEIQNSYQQPRIRYVLGTKTVVRSGPSDRYYSTNELPPSSRVEVYLETSDGWSGIRPPEDSYNWVSAKNTYLLPGGKIAEVAEEDTPAWVGTDFKDVKQLMWQTALVKSQQLQILGEEYQIDENGSKQLWYRISPPPGEFRWVRSSTLTDHVPATGLLNPKTTKGTENNKTETNIAENNKVEQASYSTAVGSGVTQAAAQDIAIGDSVDGQIVWSDESEVVARINQEIRKEQSEIVGQLPQGASVDHTDIVDNSLVVSGAIPVESAMTPQELNRAKRRQQAQHQTDSFQHWNKMQDGSQTTFTSKPIGSILGLVGLGVIEAERAPVTTQMSHSMQQFPQSSRQSSLTTPYGSSRLDRLPRPGQRRNSIGPTTPYSDGDGYYHGDDIGSNDQNTNRMSDSQLPIMERLLSSNQPLFGSDQPTPQAYDSGRDFSYAEPMPRDWHGISTPRIKPVSVAMQNAFEEPLENEKFSTPELQRTLLELSGVVSQPTENWELGRLRARCLDWIEAGDSAIVRGEARLLLERIEQFEDLRVRTLQSLQNHGGYGSRDSMLANQPVFSPKSPTNDLGGSQTAVIPASAVRNLPPNNVPVSHPSDMGAGDASGWLVQVHATSPGQPEYALTDDAGNVITYVRSTAALNLRRYLQQPVMIQGVRGYIPALAAKQIVAERVVRLR
ncbi:MAG: hypothetical protein MUC43_06650 [Pirellula sp.]|jgi:hypothetical protein|nr:hypothetical protein [Pirellula sp.]